MIRLTFSFESTSPLARGRVTLTPLADDVEIPQRAWDRLAAGIAEEPTLIHYTSAVLAARWADGYAAVTVFKDEIVAYICLAPIYFDGNRHKFAQALRVDVAAMPDVDVYEFTTAWTAPAWRRRGISSQMRPPLLARCFHADGEFSAAPTLGASGMAGLASPVLAKLGWCIMAWSSVAFVSSFTGIPLNGFEPTHQVGWRPPVNLERYEGPHIPLQDRCHPWGKYTYFWASEPALAQSLDRRIADLAQGDLHRWRRAVIDVFQMPDEVHRVAFLD